MGGRGGWQALSGVRCSRWTAKTSVRGRLWSGGRAAAGSGRVRGACGCTRGRVWAARCFRAATAAADAAAADGVRAAGSSDGLWAAGGADGVGPGAAGSAGSRVWATSGRRRCVWASAARGRRLWGRGGTAAAAATGGVWCAAWCGGACSTVGSIWRLWRSSPFLSAGWYRPTEPCLQHASLLLSCMIACFHMSHPAAGRVGHGGWATVQAGRRLWARCRAPGLKRFVRAAGTCACDRVWPSQSAACPASTTNRCSLRGPGGRTDG